MNIKPDVLVVWPKNADYPIWRQFIRDNRDKFEKVIIVFMETNSGHDYRSFVHQAMSQDNCIMVDQRPLQHNEDWRDHCVNLGLSYSHSDWVWFTEQDFYPHNGFWDEVQKGLDNDASVISIYQAQRMHPCCIFIDKKTLNRTSKDFSARPSLGFDHFGKLQLDLETLEPTVIGYTIDHNTYFHYNGLSHNFALMSRGEDPNYDVWRFAEYLDKCREVKVPLNPHFIELIQGYFVRKYPEFL